MQLRIARLCLDCEELFVGDSCPVCASQHYAFLAQWLPSEERRKWRRAPVRTVDPAPTTLAGVAQTYRRFVAWLFDDEPLRRPVGPPRTRRSDVVPAMKFDETPPKNQNRPAPAGRAVKSDVR